MNFCPSDPADPDASSRIREKPGHGGAATNSAPAGSCWVMSSATEGQLRDIALLLGQGIGLTICLQGADGDDLTQRDRGVGLAHLMFEPELTLLPKAPAPGRSCPHFRSVGSETLAAASPSDLGPDFLEFCPPWRLVMYWLLV